jgi:acetylglutamate kinase
MAEQISSDLGRVGRVTQVNADYLTRLIEADYIPVLSSIATDGRGGCLNVNADVVAGEVASAVGAHKLVYITDVDGIYEDFSDKTTLIARLTDGEAERLMEAGDLSEGMIPKVSSMVKAIRSGVPRAHIVNGTRPHSVLLEMLTDEGIGTMMTPEHDYGPERVDDSAAQIGALAEHLNF